MNAQPAAPTTNVDDQELAKALAGMTDQFNATPSTDDAELKFEEAPSPVGAVADPAFSTPAADPEPATAPEPAAEEPAADEPTPADEPASSPAPTADSSELESIKKTALNELRPLVGKLTIASEEKFDTYLLLLRSTDDTSLIAPAHEAAMEITDEARRAQALLDIIKEIDYLSGEHKAE